MAMKFMKSWVFSVVMASLLNCSNVYSSTVGLFCEFLRGSQFAMGFNVHLRLLREPCISQHLIWTGIFVYWPTGAVEPSLPGVVAVTVVVKVQVKVLSLVPFQCFFFLGGGPLGTIKYKAFPLNPKHAGVFCERIRGSFVVDNLGALD